MESNLNVNGNFTFVRKKLSVGCCCQLLKPTTTKILDNPVIIVGRNARSEAPHNKPEVAFASLFTTPREYTTL